MKRFPAQRIAYAVLAAMLLFAVALPLDAQTPRRPAITGIAFVRLYTTNTTAADNFYGKTLGLRLVRNPGLEVYPVNSAQWIELTPTGNPPDPNIRLISVGLTTRSVRQMAAYLTAKGVKISEQPHPDKLSQNQFSIRDPEGNLITFVQAGSNRQVATAPLSPTATSRRIIHAGFLVTSAEREDGFYRDLLGFRPYWHGGMTDQRTDFISIQVPDGTDWIEYMLNVQNRDLRQMGIVDHLSLGVERMDDAIAALQRNHCQGPDCGKTQMGRDGKVQLNLYDPDSTRIEFMEFKPRQIPCCSPFTGMHPTSKENR